MVFNLRAGVCGVALLLVALPLSAHASQSMAAPECTLRGIVASAVEREEPGRGISQGQSFEYLDIAVEIKQSGFAVEGEREQFSTAPPPFNCGRESGDVAVYQARDADDFSQGEGDCIAAKSKFHADGNFRSGNWIYEIESLPASDCE